MGKYDKYRQPQTTQQSKYSDIINKYKKKEADKDMGIFWTAKQQLWEVTSQVYQGIKNIPKEEWLIRKTWGDFEKRAENINQNNATMPMWDRKTLRNAGQLLGAANDFIGNTFVSWIKTFVPKSLRDSAKDVWNLALETKPGQMTKEVAKSAYTQWKAFEKSNPELAKDLWAVGNIANFALNFVGGSQATKLKPTGLSDDILSNINRTVKKNTSNISTATQRMASKIPWQVDNLATGTGEVGISAATGLSREAQQIIKKQPWLYQQARQGTITREAVTDDVVGALSKRMDDISDLWKGYETIRTSSITVPKNDIANIAVSHLDDLKVSKIDLPIGDRGTVQKALDYIRELPDTMTAQNALSLRRKFDDLINWKSEATGEGKRIIKGLRKKVDDYLGEKLPWLKDLDRKYWPEREFIDKVKGTILDKQWNLKDGAISSVANMIGKGKEMKLDRFEKLLPWIGDKVRALKAFEEIQNLAQIKTGSVARQIFSFAVGWIPWFVATNPYVVGYALEKYGFAKEAIKRILSKGKKISEAEAKAVHRAVKNVSRKEVEKIIAWKVGTPLLPAGKSSVATGNTAGNIPPADLTPNASTWNAVSSQARTSPTQSVWLLDSPKSTISETTQQVSTPVVKSAWEKVIPPIIPKSQPKAKLRTNEDALKKPKTPQDNPMSRYWAGNRWLTELSDATVEWNNLWTEEARSRLLSEFQTEKWKAFLNEIVEKIPKNKDGTITAYRTGKIGGDKPQSYTLSEWLAKTFSNEGTDISIKTFWKADNKDFGMLETSMVKIDPKWIKWYSPFDSEILVDSKFVKVDKPVSKTPQEGKTAKEAKLDATINKQLIEEAKNHTDFVDFFQSKLWDKQPTKENLMKLWFSAEDIARNTDSLWISLEDLFHEIKTWKLSSYPAKPKPSLPLSQKSEVKYSDLASEAKKYKSAEDFVKEQKWTEIFHGTKKSTPDISKKEFQLDNKDRPTPWISFSVDKKRASDYWDNIIEARIKPDAKIIKLDEAIKKWDITQLDWNLRSSEDEAIKWAKENWYDGIDISDAKSDWYKEEKEIRVFNKDAIYTKQQLIDIFNKSKS